MNYLIIVSVIISILWGIYYIIQKQLVINLPFEIVMYLSTLLYFICLNFLFYDKVFTYENYKNLNNFYIFLILINVIIFVTLPNYLFNKLLVEHDVGLISVLVSLSPLWTVLLAIFIFKETLNLIQWLGIGLCISGIICVSLKN
jgi:drug/metabolite transporter (DMT)-like permease